MCCCSWTSQPTESVVDAARRGEVEAFDEIVRRFLPAMRSLALHMLADGDNMRDIVQEAALRAFKGLPTLKHPENVGAWLQAITRRCVLRDYLNPRLRS
jgi:RNA polymerase sigma-70 factor (ECF subfamily)